ncbi:MAG: hypothetical protein LBS82_04780 [Spirochaetaceae bacterium]|jgi:hypothetical protein|nr:hypothetical protein [Spirochaetaceae bacterium]
MPHKKDWLQGSRQETLGKAELWTNTLGAVETGSGTNAARWGIPAPLLDALKTQTASCAGLLAKTSEPEQATSVVRWQCTTAFALLKQTMRQMHRFFYLPTFPENELSRLGLEPHSKTRSEQTEPKIHAGSKVKLLTYGQVMMICWVEETGEQRIPRDMDGLMLFTRISDEPITETSELHESQRYTTHRFILDYPQELRGKTVYCSLRWESASNVLGPWSLIGSFMIP